MTTSASTTTALARGQVYGFLSLAFAYPEAAWLSSLSREGTRLEPTLARLSEEAGIAAARRLRPIIAGLTLERWRAAHGACFGHTISKECPPYEGEYGQAHIFQQTQTLADIAGFYRAFGLELAADVHERMDHISVELEFMHFLCRKEAYALERGHPPERIAQVRAAQAKFLSEHLGAWVPQFAGRLCARDESGLYGRLGELLEAYVRGELRRIGVEPEAIAQAGVAAPTEDAPEPGSCWTPECGVAAESEVL